MNLKIHTSRRFSFFSCIFHTMLTCKLLKVFLFFSLSTFYIIYIFHNASKLNLNFLNNYYSNNLLTNEGTALPWYFKNGTIRPTIKDIKGLWPNESSGDRILNQLMYFTKSSTLKKIFVVESKYAYLFNPKIGKKFFRNCPVSDCIIVDDKKSADAVIYGNKMDDKRNSSIPQSQIWIFYILENPLRYPKEKNINGINWTATYRRDSDIEVPYGKWLYYNESIKFKEQDVNYGKNKTKKVAWFVSNCEAKNKRMEYAKELQKYIQVDIYGRCGDKECPWEKRFQCMKMLAKEYKFYLAFENGNCRDYITEKLFLNSLQHDVLPIVMGAHPKDYERVAPLNSYIHVDYFSSPKALANYLHVLDENDYLYNSYFKWKGTGEFIDNLFLCRLCAMLHSNYKIKMYDNFTNWWNKSGLCVKESWLS